MVVLRYCIFCLFIVLHMPVLASKCEDNFIAGTLERKSVIFTRSTWDVLNTNGISNLMQLITYTESALLKLQGFQRTNVDEIKKKIGELHFSLGMKDWIYNPNVSRIDLVGDFIQPGAHAQTENRREKSNRKQRTIIADLNHLYPVLDLKLDSLNLSSLTRNIFKDMDFKYVGDVIPFSAGDLMSLRGLGTVSLNEFEEILSGLGVYLEMDVGDWSPPLLTIRTSLPADQRSSSEDASVNQVTELEEVSAESDYVAKIGHQRNTINQGRSEDALIEMSKSIYYTPEFLRWFNQNNLHSAYKNKIENIVERFENEGETVLGPKGMKWRYFTDGLHQLKLKQNAAVVVYFTIVNGTLYMLDGDKIVDGAHRRQHQIDKAKELISKYGL